jgi:TolB-like protein
MDRAPSILVVPLSVGGNGTDPWSGSGLAEEIRVALAANGAVRIRRVEPSTVSKPIGASDSVGAAIHARRAGADYVIIGAVGRKAGKSEIGLRLVRATDATTAWSGTFWRSPTDLSTFAADLAAAVTEAVTTDRTKQARLP